MTADITVSDWTPVGSEGRWYQGIFDGGNHTITIKSINGGASEAGLFGYTKGTVKNVSVAGTITTTGNTARGVAAYNNGKISYCINKASVAAAETAGGIVGENEQTSYGNSDSTMVEGCTNSGTVTATGAGSYAGGIVGRNDAVARRCTNSSTDIRVNNADSYAGGIAGYNCKRIQKCDNITATASTSANYGGVIGYNTLPDNYKTDIEWVNNCYTQHNVFVYYAAKGRITNSYTSGGSFNSAGSGTAYQNCYATSGAASGRATMAGTTPKSSGTEYRQRRSRRRLSSFPTKSNGIWRNGTPSA